MPDVWSDRFRAQMLIPLLGLAVLACSAVCPAISQAESSPTPSQLEVQEYQADFGVSAAFAEQNLELQSKGAGIVEFLRRVLGENYAGVSFDNAAGVFDIPVVPGVDRPQLASDLEKLGLGSSSYRFAPAQFSWKQLESAQMDLAGILKGEVNPRHAVTTIDPQANAVVIQEAQEISKADAAVVRGAAAERNIVDLHEVPTEELGVETQGCDSTRPRNCDRPLRGGVEIGPWISVNGGYAHYAGQCTAGFKATGNVFGNRFILTAGHCFATGIQNWGSETPNEVGIAKVGWVEEYNFGPTGDWGKINANGTYWDTANWPSLVTHYWANHTYPIHYEAWPFPGQYLCFSGNKEGTSCGNVANVRVHGLYDTKFGTYLPPLIQVPGICTFEGDSGGPLYNFSANTAIGILSAREPGPCAATSAYFAEITAATTNLGVTVGTRVGGPPSATTGGATNIQPRQVTVNGTVNPNQVSTKFRFDLGQTTSYGRAAPSPDGDAGHGGPVPVAATFDNLLPNETYNYRLFATSAAGVSYGSNASVTTKAVPPVVATAPATNISGTAATLNATINPEGAPTSYYFEYGPSPAFGTKSTEVSVGAGRSPVSVSVPVSGLEFGGNYYFRVVARSIGGTSTGTTQSFTPGWRRTTELQIPSGLEPPLNGPDVDCAAVHSCVAVASAKGASESVQAFASTYDGTKWTSTLVPTPIAGNDMNHLSDVSCITPTNCRAIGWTAKVGVSGQVSPAVAHWNGSTWQSTAISSPPGMPAIVPEAIACPSSSFCLAVGYFQDANGVRKEVYLKWDGTSWTYPSSPPSEGATYATLTSVDCASATYCFATGFYFKANGEQVVFVNRWNGIGWTREVVNTYVGSEQLHRLSSMSCPGPTLCVSAGVSTTGGRNVPLLGKTNGAGWTLTPLIDIPLATDKASGFSRIVCGSETTCEGVGYVENASGQLLPLAARMLAGGSWQRQILPELAPERSTLGDLSCASPTYCMAVGTRGGYFSGRPIAGLYAK